MGALLSCILGDSEEALSPSRINNKYIYSPTSPGNPKAKMKSDRIDAFIERQSLEQSNIVKILLLGKGVNVV